MHICWLEFFGASNTAVKTVKIDTKLTASQLKVLMDFVHVTQLAPARSTVNDTQVFSSILFSSPSTFHWNR